MENRELEKWNLKKKKDQQTENWVNVDEKKLCTLDKKLS